MAEQHGRWGKENPGFISRLAYIYEYKQENPKIKGRKELVNKYYFSGLYGESKGVQQFWEEIQKYIEQNYNSDELQKVFVSGDGGNWIKSATTYVDRSLYCVDKYHMTKYINAASKQMLDEAEEAKENLYRFIYKKQRSKSPVKRGAMARKEAYLLDYHVICILTPRQGCEALVLSLKRSQG